MQLDYLHLALVAVAAVLGWVLRRKGSVSPDGKVVVPDLVPDYPAVNVLLKVVVQKLLDDAYLQTPEIQLAKAFRDTIAKRFPELAAVIDALTSTPAKPAVPA